MYRKYFTCLYAALLILVSFFNSQAQNTGLIKKRVVDELLAPSVNEAGIQQLIKTIQPDGTWPGINYQDVSRTGFQHKDHLDNMLALARAYKKPGTPLFTAPAVKQTFSLALDYWLAHDFRCDNWWWNEMGTPNLMINTLLVMDSSLTPTQRTEGLKIAHRANMETFGARPGGDLIPIAGMLAKQGLLLGSADTLKKALQAMAADIKISNGRGLQPDMSFHHRTDNVISTLTYGSNYASSFAYWAAKIQGAGFSFPDASVKLVTDYFLDGICQSMVYATYPDPGAMNRDISRKMPSKQKISACPETCCKRPPIVLKNWPMSSAYARVKQRPNLPGTVTSGIPIIIPMSVRPIMRLYVCIPPAPIIWKNHTMKKASRTIIMGMAPFS